MLRILIILLLRSVLICNAQNHVPNPGFEDKYACPSGTAQVTSHCKEWYSYVPPGTPDYYHICAFPVAPPLKNYLGANYAYDSAAVGISMWPSGEYVATKIAPLAKDSFYEVSLYAVVSGVGFAVDGMGAFFFKNFVDTYKSTVPITAAVTPQVDYSRYGPIWDSINWKRLTGYFVADSAYTHMVVGQFKDSGSVTRIRTLLFPRSSTSYTVIDSVVVKKVKNINVEFDDSLLCAGDTISVGCFVRPQYFGSGNVFTLQLSDGNGSFTNAVNIGSITATQNDTITGVIPANLPQGNNYRLRIVSNMPAYASDDNGFPIKIGPFKPVKPVITTNAPICEKKLLTMTATTITTGVDWYWMNQFGQIIGTANIYSRVFQLKDTGYYMAFASNGGCLSQPDSVYPAIWPYQYPAVLWHVSPGLKVNIGTLVTYSAQAYFVGPNPVYHWYVDGSPVHSSTDSFYSGIYGTHFYQGDTICVKIFSNYQCKLRDSTYTCQPVVKDLASVSEMNDEQVAVYPNPAHDYVLISNLDKGVRIEIYTPLGTKVYTLAIAEHENDVKIPVANFMPGLYFARICFEDGHKSSVRFYKQ